MKRSLTLIFILLLMLLPACSLPTAIPPPTPFDLDTVQTAVAATLAAQPAASATVIPTPSSSPTAKVSYDNTTSANRIQFAPGGTWAEVTANGKANQPVNFVLGAMQGQMMSVSVYENWGYLVSVKGRDGALLSIENNDDSFWRGTLPATQDYFVTVTPQVDGSFTLRVAINPPGEARQLFQYNDPHYPVSLTYSDAFAPANYPYVDQQRGAPRLVLDFIDTAFYNKTNLSEAYFVLNLFADPNIVDTCNQLAEGEEARGQETYNGLTFDQSFGGGAGAGNYYMQTKYRTVHNNVCVEVIFFVHSTNIGNYTPGTVTEYNDAALMQKFLEVLKTLVWK